MLSFEIKVHRLCLSRKICFSTSKASETKRYSCCCLNHCHFRIKIVWCSKCAVYSQKRALAFFPFYPYTISMLSFRTGLLQYRLSPPKAQIPPYFQKVLDTRSFVGIITQQLSNSATQQLSNSATQQLRRKVCLSSAPITDHIPPYEDSGIRHSALFLTYYIYTVQTLFMRYLYYLILLCILSVLFYHSIAITGIPAYSKNLTGRVMVSCPWFAHLFSTFYAVLFSYFQCSEVVQERNRLRTPSWNRSHNRYRLWNTFFNSFLAYSRKEEDGNYDSR